VRPEVEELRPQLKAILYDCAVEIRATKAAVYVFDGSSKFELLTEYGFRSGGIRQWADFNDPIVDRCGRGRTTFFVNGLAAEPRFSSLLYEASTDRLLVSPLYSRGKLIGFIDMRDKSGEAPFESADAPKAQHIADRMVEVFAAKDLFRQNFIALSKLSGPQPAANPDGGNVSAVPPVRDHPIEPHPLAPSVAPPPPAPAPVIVPTPAPAPMPAPAPVHVQPPPASPAMRGVPLREAREAALRIPAAAPPVTLTEEALSAAKEVLRSLLLIPGAILVSFNAFGHLGGLQEIAARSMLTDDARKLLDSKVSAWLAKRGETGSAVQTSVHTPYGTSAPLIAAADVQKIFTAPLSVGTMRGLFLTVAFAGNPDRVAHELLAVMHAHLQLVIEQAMQRGTAAALQSRIAEKLVEPDLAKYPELRRHSDAVAALTERFARFLALTPPEIESARLVALVHDAGMRLLDYDRLYRKPSLTEDELGLLRQHPIVGAAIVEPLLGPEIARAVLCHHERADGLGYPNALRGQDIPLLSRIVQICDTWIAITDPDGYQKPDPPEYALGRMTVAAGSQFDGELCLRFVEMMKGR
jgi:HD domain-containing protein